MIIAAEGARRVAGGGEAVQVRMVHICASVGGAVGESDHALTLLYTDLAVAVEAT
ncbi:hypothetical protein GCM10009610_36980 [Pseudonocardia xinjiangensis]